MTHQNKAYLFHCLILVLWICFFPVKNALCSDTSSWLRSQFNLGIQYEDSEFQSQLIKEMGASNIPYLIGSDGVLYFRDVDENKVNSIIDRLRRRPHIIITDKDFAQSFIKALKKNKIEIRVSCDKEDNATKVFWNEEDDKKVKSIVEKISQESLRKKEQELNKKNSKKCK